MASSNEPTNSYWRLAEEVIVPAGPARASLLVGRFEVRKFGGTNAINLHQLPADLVTQPFGLVLLVVLDFHFEEEMSAIHKALVYTSILRE